MHKLEQYRQNIVNCPLLGNMLIAAFYFFGTMGIMRGYGEWFVPKTAFNLLLSFLILLGYQKGLSYKFLLAIVVCYLIGYSAEFLGVNYGLIFGDYYYPPTLGPQLGKVPIIIGVNWFIITFLFWSIVSELKLSAIIKIILASLFATLLDVIIEPVAMSLDFWQWQGGEVPLQNYLGWFIISSILCGFYHYLKLPTKNAMVRPLLFWQLFFFTILFIFFL